MKETEDFSYFVWLAPKVENQDQLNNEYRRFGNTFNFQGEETITCKHFLDERKRGLLELTT